MKIPNILQIRKKGGNVPSLYISLYLSAQQYQVIKMVEFSKSAVANLWSMRSERVATTALNKDQEAVSIGLKKLSFKRKCHEYL